MAPDLVPRSYSAGALAIILLLSSHGWAAATGSSIEKSTSAWTSITVVKPSESEPPPDPTPTPPPSKSRTERLYEDPLNQRVGIHLDKVSIRAFLDDLARQSHLKFKLVGDVGPCTVTAYMHAVTVRDAMQVLLELYGLSYEHFGNPSSPYIFVPRHGRHACPNLSPRRPISGFCKETNGAPISLQCESGPASKFAEIVFEQSDVNFIFGSEAENYPVTARLKEATPTEALEEILSDKDLTLNEFGRSTTYLISARTAH